MPVISHFAASLRAGTLMPVRFHFRCVLESWYIDACPLSHCCIFLVHGHIRTFLGISLVAHGQGIVTCAMQHVRLSSCGCRKHFRRRCASCTSYIHDDKRGRCRSFIFSCVSFSVKSFCVSSVVLHSCIIRVVCVQNLLCHVSLERDCSESVAGVSSPSVRHCLCKFCQRDILSHV